VIGQIGGHILIKLILSVYRTAYVLKTEINDMNLNVIKRGSETGFPMKVIYPVKGCATPFPVREYLASSPNL